MGEVMQFPRAATWRRVATVRGSIYDQAYEGARYAQDWPTRLGYAETLSKSPDWTHTSLARHIRTAYSLHLEQMLKPVDPAHRDRSDMVDGWREGALRAETEETPLRVAMQHAGTWPDAIAGAIAFVVYAWLLFTVAGALVGAL